MTILFSGGGTLGSVTPLLAIKEILAAARPETKFFWVGTAQGPERAFVERAGIPFFSISSGKFRRYYSLWNVTDIARMAVGFFQSLFFLKKYSPDICISAGGFVSVPVHYAAFFSGKRTWIHQQDVTAGLANRLMARVAGIITCALEKSAADFGKKIVIWIGNPVRQDIMSPDSVAARARFGLQPDLPVVLATGGGTGSFRLNQLVVEALPYLHAKCQVLHLTGGERGAGVVERACELFPTYHVYDFFTDEMRDAYAAADIVVGRGGFGTLSELSAIGAPAVIIPKGGHQEENAAFFADQGAVVSLHEFSTNGQEVSKHILEILSDPGKQRSMIAALQSLLPPARAADVLRVLNQCLK